MRDINEDLHRNPFDEELREIAGRLGTLLREIVVTIDTYGLKKTAFGQAQSIGSRVHRGCDLDEMCNGGSACAQEEN
jgi:hypothetical protein